MVCGCMSELQGKMYGLAFETKTLGDIQLNGGVEIMESINVGLEKDVSGWA